MALFGKFWQLLKICNLTAACRPAPPRAAAPHSAASTAIPGRKSSNPANPRDPLSQPQRAHDHGNSFSGSEGQPHSAICESTLAPGSQLYTTPRPIATAEGQTRRPGTRNWCFGDTAKEKKQPRNSSLSDRSRENS